MQKTSSLPTTYQPGRTDLPPAPVVASSNLSIAIATHACHMHGLIFLATTYDITFVPAAAGRKASKIVHSSEFK